MFNRLRSLLELWIFYSSKFLEIYIHRTSSPMTPTCSNMTLISHEALRPPWYRFLETNSAGLLNLMRRPDYPHLYCGLSVIKIEGIKQVNAMLTAEIIPPEIVTHKVVKGNEKCTEIRTRHPSWLSRGTATQSYLRYQWLNVKRQ